MTIQRVNQRLESLDFVESAGAAPTDIGKLPCWQVYLTSMQELNNVNKQTIEDVVRSGYEFPHDGERRVTVSKDIIDSEPDAERPCFWVFAYGVFATESIGGIQYDIVEWTPEAGVTAVQTDYADPRSSIERFRWSEVMWRPEELND